MHTLHNDALILLLEPSNSVFLGYLVLVADSSGSDLASGDSVSGSDQHNIEIHSENASGGIVFQAQINVLSNTETKATSTREVLLLQLILLHLQTTVKDLVGLEATNSHVNSDLLVSSDTESSDGVSGCKVACKKPSIGALNPYPWSKRASYQSAAPTP